MVVSKVSDAAIYGIPRTLQGCHGDETAPFWEFFARTMLYAFRCDIVVFVALVFGQGVVRP